LDIIGKVMAIKPLNKEDFIKWKHTSRNLLNSWLCFFEPSPEVVETLDFSGFAGFLVK